MTVEGPGTVDERLEALKAAAERLMTSDIAKEMPGFTVPLPGRTRRKTSAIVAGAAYLLQTRQFAEVTLDDIASIAGCSVPSIYARFENKEALLLAVHLLTIENIRARLDREIVLDRFIGKSLEYFCNVFLDVIIDYFDQNNNLIVATIVGRSTVVHHKLRHLIPLLTERLNKIVPLLVDKDPAETRPAVHFGLGVIISLLRDAAIVPSFEGNRDRKALAKILERIIETGLYG